MQLIPQKFSKEQIKNASSKALDFYYQHLINERRRRFSYYDRQRLREIGSQLKNRDRWIKAAEEITEPAGFYENEAHAKKVMLVNLEKLEYTLFEATDTIAALSNALALYNKSILVYSMYPDDTGKLGDKYFYERYVRTLVFFAKELGIANQVVEAARKQFQEITRDWPRSTLTILD